MEYKRSDIGKHQSKRNIDNGIYIGNKCIKDKRKDKDNYPLEAFEDISYCVVGYAQKCTKAYEH